MALTKISTGELRHYITFQTKVLGSVDANGQRAITWTDARSLWAKLEVKAAGEARDGSRSPQLTMTLFTIRAVAGLSSDMRILYRGRFYAIGSIYDKDGTGKWLTVEATHDESKNLSSEVV